MNPYTRHLQSLAPGSTDSMRTTPSAASESERALWAWWHRWARGWEGVPLCQVGCLVGEVHTYYWGMGVPDWRMCDYVIK